MTAAKSYPELFERYVGEVSRLDDKYIDLNLLETMVDKRRNPSSLQFPVLKLITSNFLDELRIGSGGCGDVYKVNYFFFCATCSGFLTVELVEVDHWLIQGILRNGFIAVKKLFNSHTIEDKMFHQEVKSMMMVRHPNIVRFLGYCSHTEEIAINLPAEKEKQLPERTIMAQIRERLLCFEYISKGGLENYLTGTEKVAAQINGLEDMLGVEPLEKLLRFEPNKQVSCSIQLANDTDDKMAFSISQTGLSPYNIHPSIDIVCPRSKLSVSIALKPLKEAPPHKCCTEVFIVQSTRVDASLKAADITGDLFDEEPGRVVDKVEFILNLDVPTQSINW
ncbi:hypothetical protein PR202_gb23601 [Eleusine coracana subsp. coracana]|uniref:MSP domain-containing protein n=1 Tax=Eleusine coracana subsp. coracana TaxID=191504 RepID=A0AAV5FJ77_ELECO|nr:hypothetical protein PR202_gb23601 [Eleusine coracana subsp. coracana]